MTRFRLTLLAATAVALVLGGWAGPAVAVRGAPAATAHLVPARDIVRDSTLPPEGQVYLRPGGRSSEPAAGRNRGRDLAPAARGAVSAARRLLTAGARASAARGQRTHGAGAVRGPPPAGRSTTQRLR